VSEGSFSTDMLDAVMRASLAKMAAQADALYDMSQTAGYAVLMEYLEKLEVDLGRHGLRDMEHSRDYYVGAQDMIAKLLGLVPFIIERGREAAATEAIQKNPEFVSRFVTAGSGSLS